MCHSIQNWLFGSNSFFDLCYSMLPLFVKDDLAMAAVATTVLHALICKACLNISSTKDDQLLDRAKTTLVCVTTSEFIGDTQWHLVIQVIFTMLKTSWYYKLLRPKYSERINAREHSPKFPINATQILTSTL